MEVQHPEEGCSTEKERKVSSMRFKAKTKIIKICVIVENIICCSIRLFALRQKCDSLNFNKIW